MRRTIQSRCRVARNAGRLTDIEGMIAIHRGHCRMRSWFVGLVFSLLVSGCGPRVEIVRAPDPRPTAGGAVALAALAALKENHVDRPDPVRLLEVAVGALRRSLSSLGIDVGEVELTGLDETAAVARFQGALERAVVLARGRMGEIELQYIAASAMAASVGDSHTRFFTADEFRAHIERLQGRPGYAGIGAVPVRSDGRFYLWHVFPGGPAARAGLRPFDQVLAVDGHPIEGLTMAESTTRVRGPQGTLVRLAVRRQGEAAPVVVTVVREPIPVPAVGHERLEPGSGYVRLLAFSQGASDGMRQATDELLRQGTRAFVLDLRFNEGGLIRELEQVAGMFLPAGQTVYHQQTRKGTEIRVSVGGSAALSSLPLVVLVNEETKSSAEVLAAALRDNGRAVLIGTPTSGRTQQARDFALPGGAGLAVPVARLRSPLGTDLEGDGLLPDVHLELAPGDLERGVDSQLREGIEVIARRLPRGRSREGFERTLSLAR